MNTPHPGKPCSEEQPTNASDTEADENLETMALFAAQIDSRTRCSRQTTGAADRAACSRDENTPEAEPTTVGNATHRIR